MCYLFSDDCGYDAFVEYTILQVAFDEVCVGRNPCDAEDLKDYCVNHKLHLQVSSQQLEVFHL